MKKIYIILIQLFVFTLSWGQLATDAFRYSAVQYGGTARSVGVGNSMSVLGGDFGTITTNPAGLAMYRGSDFTMSMGYLSNNTTSLLKGSNFSYEEPANKVTFNNVGLVFASEPWRNAKWKTGNFAIGLNKLADFNRTIYYDGTSAGSIVTLFKNQANIGQWDDFGNSLAYEAEALFDSTIGGVKKYYSDFDGKETAIISRSQKAQTTGRVQELSISYGANFDEKLMVGVSIGVPFAKYTLNNNYSERDNNNAISFFNDLNYIDRYTADGTGINLKVGAIYRPIHMLRIGVAVHTPTSYNFSEIRTADFTYNLTTSSGNFNNTELSPEGETEYIINTPWKTLASVGVVIGQYGFITADAEYINYASAKIRFDTPDSIGAQRISDLKQYEAKVNTEIKDTYKSALNLRVGGEVALDVFRFRAGVNMLSATKVDEEPRMIYSVGAGLRGQKVYFDVAYRFEKQNFNYQPYYAANEIRQPNVDVNTNNNSFVATLGFRF